MQWPSDIPLFDIIDHAGDAIFIADAETGMLLYGNRKACELTGRTPEEIVSMHQSDLHPEEERDIYSFNFRECRDKSRYISKGDRYLVTRDGTKVPVEICATTLAVNGRKIIKGIFRDLSERKTVETMVQDIFNMLGNLVNEHDTAVSKHKLILNEILQELGQVERKHEGLTERYRNMFYVVETPVLVFDGNETIFWVNRAFERMSGHFRHELEGRKNWMDCIAFDDLERLKSYRYDIIKNRIKEDEIREFRLVVKNGTVKPVYITLAMIPCSDLGLASIIDATILRRNDETERKRQEKLEMRCHQLEKANKELLVLLKYSENEKSDVEGNILANVKELIMPYITELKRRSAADARRIRELTILEACMKNILSPFSRRLTLNFYRLSPREIEVANLIREGKTTKEIKEILHLSKSTVDLHRHGIRKKLHLTGKKSNLRSFLLSLQ